MIANALKIIPTPQKFRRFDAGWKIYARDRVYTLCIMEEQTAKLIIAAE